MKGLVFTTFFSHVEERYGVEMVDDIIEAARLPHDGAYTSVGTYPFTEMVSLVTALTAATGTPLPTTLDAFGAYCIQTWVNYAPQFFRQSRKLFDILESVDEFHETEVRRLYPDAELPSFVKEERSETRLVLGYYSCKPLAALAMGAIKGAAEHLGQSVEVSCQSAQGPRGAYTRIFVDLTAG